MKIEDFLAPHKAATLDDLDERTLHDLRAFLEQRTGRNLEDATEQHRPRLRGRAAEFAKMVQQIDDHISERGLDAPRPGL